MGIAHILEIDDRYTNIDRWSIICDIYLLNVFSDYCYSISLIKYFKSTFDKSNEKNKIVFYIFFHLLWSLGLGI